MPTGAGFGIGAVVSILHKNLKPRSLSQRIFGTNFQFGRTDDFVVEGLTDANESEPPRAIIFSPTFPSDFEGNRLVFSAARGVCKIVQPAPLENRVQAWHALHNALVLSQE